MHLESCDPPIVALVPAPLTALCRPSNGERWDGFWTTDLDSAGRETYYLRCQLGTVGGVSVRWYRMVNDELAPAAIGGDEPARASSPRRKRTA